MKTLHLVVGTVTGTAASCANYLQKKFESHFNIVLHDYPNLDEIITAPNQFIVFCVSNTGVGELPPSMRRVFVQLTQENRALNGHEYLIINFGDSSFKTYGKSGITLDNALKQCGATPLDERLLIDAMHDRYPRKSVLDWLNNTLIKHGKIAQ